MNNEMKKKIYRYPDCEHEGDVQAGEELVRDVLTAIGSNGRVTHTDWNEDEDYGEPAIIHFTIEADKVTAFNEKTPRTDVTNHTKGITK